MPRFAANLSFDPIQPQQAAVLQPTVEPPVPLPPRNEVPAAQFDWSSAGLVNPLDGELKKLKS